MKKWCILLFVSVSCHVYAQTRIDSLNHVLPNATGTERITLLNELAYLYARVSPDTSNQIAQEALKLSEELENITGKVDALNTIGLNHRSHGDYNAALENYRQAKVLAESVDYKVGLGHSLNSIGVVYDFMGDFDKALKYYYQSLALKEQIGDKKGIGDSYLGIGIVQWYQENYEDALDSYQKALLNYEAIGLKYAIASALGNIGLVYSSMNQYNKALEYYDQALDMHREINDEYGASNVLGNIGNIHKEKGNYDIALKYTSDAFTIKERLGLKWGMVNLINELGDLHILIQNYKKASNYLNQAQTLAQEINAMDLLKNNYQFQSKYFSTIKDYRSALKYYRLYSAMKDSIYNEESSKRIQEIQTKYEIEKKESEIELLRRDRDIQALRIEQQTTVRNSLIGGSGLLLILAIVIFNRYRIKSKANKDLELAMQQLQDTEQKLILKEKMASLGNLVAGVAHEINTPIGAVNSASDVSRRAIENIEREFGRAEESNPLRKNQKLLKGFNILKENNVVSLTASKRICSIVQSLKSFARLDEAEFQTADIHSGLDSTLTLMHHRYKNRVEVIKDYGDIPQIECYPNQLNQVFMNLFVNADDAIVEKGKVKIKTYTDVNWIYIKISDTGRGIPRENLNKIFDPGFTTKGVGVGTGLGLSICYSIIEKHKGMITVKSKVDKGTEFTVALPLE